MSRAEAIAAALEPACKERFGAGVQVEGVHRLAGGASQETWAFDVADPTGESRSLVLRRDRGGPAFGLARREEYALHGAAERSGVPVPTLHFFLEAAGEEGLGYVMDRVPGESIPRRILRAPELEGARDGLAAQCGEALARVHAIPKDEVGFLPAPEPDRTPAMSQLRFQQNLFDSLGEPHPVLEVAFRWLADHEPPCDRVTVVHGDFRNGNLIVGPDGLKAVLDWELAHLGDPMEDLGWMCVRSWRFGHDDRPVGGFGRREDFFAAYERASGHTVDPDVVRYWEVFGTLKWGVICMMQAAAHYQGLKPSVELAAIGRRTCETEWDLLELIG